MLLILGASCLFSCFGVNLRCFYAFFVLIFPGANLYAVCMSVSFNIRHVGYNSDPATPSCVVTNINSFLAKI